MAKMKFIFTEKNKGFALTPTSSSNLADEVGLSLQGKRGFTLVETLVAITVLLFAITGPLTIAAQSLYTARLTKDRLVAVYLAQEGIEIIRRNKTTNLIQARDWLFGMDNCINGLCTISALGASTACTGDCPQLKFDAASGIYTYAPTASESPYTRSIQIEEIAEDREVRVTSEVRWSSGRNTHSAALEENILRWK